MASTFSVPDEHEWLDDAACAELGISDYFVEAGHVIEDSVLNTCRSCPVRRDCLRHAYTRDVTGGYFGGLSPGQRRDMDLGEALEFVKKDGVDKPRIMVDVVESDPDEDFDYR